jgi:Family of unknown function (DUF6529)
MAETVAAPARTAGVATRRLVVVLLVGGAVAVALGVYGKVHDPTHEQPYTWFFTSTIQLKVWFATTALAVAQLLLGLRRTSASGRSGSSRRTPACSCTRSSGASSTGCSP